jgi:hypothetical protein
MRNSKSISVFSLNHPQSNLPAIKAGSVPESVFAEGFTESYWRAASRVHSGTSKTQMCFAREIPVNGLGIADLVSVAWNPDKELHVSGDSAKLPELKRPTVRAFEMKLDNWKKGLMQAHRYSFFSDSSILVLPSDRIGTAVDHIDLFIKLQVGLWSYNPASGSIRQYYTPRPVRPENGKHRGLVLQRVWESATAEPAV